MHRLRLYGSLCTRPDIVSFEEQLIYMTDYIIERLNTDKSLLNFIAKHLSWGIFRNSLISFHDSNDHNACLVHISQLSNQKFVKHPLEVVSVGDIVEVKVL